MEEIFSIMKLMKLQDITFLTGVALIILLSLIQGLSEKVKPWTWILKQIGKTMNEDTLKKIEELDKREKEDLKKDQDRIAKMEKDQQEFFAYVKEENIKDNRRRILRFADELAASTPKHSQESFDDILSDIDEYEKYCEKHDEFENSKSIISCKMIKETYEELKKNGKIK